MKNQYFPNQNSMFQRYIPVVHQIKVNIQFHSYLQISVFVQSLMHLGSKSFSHSFAAIAKFHPTFKVRTKLVYTITIIALQRNILICHYIFLDSLHQFLFQILSETEEAQVIVLRSLFELWKTHQQMMVVLVDKLLKTQIVECSAVANWIFSKEMVSEFTKGYTWEMLHLTIR